MLAARALKFRMSSDVCSGTDLLGAALEESAAPEPASLHIDLRVTHVAVDLLGIAPEHGKHEIDVGD